MPAIAAHRGWHVDGATKNSMAALEEAGRNGVDWVENDVRSLGDGTLVVHHDPMLADGRMLSELTVHDLADLPHVPTLDAWAKRAGELGVGGLIELKEHGAEAETVATVERYLPGHRINYMSFDHEAVRSLRALAPNRPVGLLSDLGAAGADGVRRSADAATLVANARATGASFLGLNVGQATDPVLAAAHEAGLGVAVWTVDRPADIARLLADQRVHTVISDVPRLAKSLRSSIADAGAGVRLLRAAATMR
ncbi:MAG: glycerophosphodiester phosphodiesterase [Thermoleophilia bacterium]|nr:glycerophosphodiester phosphodiesterase [Thermoleophilia bacterium]